MIEALRKRHDCIQYSGVRHEKAAAFTVSGFAKHTGKLGFASVLPHTMTAYRSWHALIVANRACRAALGNRRVAHMAIAKDI